MEEVIRLIFFLLIGLIWIISAFAKRRKMESGPPGGRDVGTGEIYKAPQDQLEHFLKMVSGEVEEVRQPVRPIIEEREEARPEVPTVEEKKEIPQPEIMTPAEIEPEHIPSEGIEEIEQIQRIEEKEVVEEPSRIGRKLAIPSNLSELQQAIVLLEILGPPRTIRPYRRVRH